MTSGPASAIDFHDSIEQAREAGPADSRLVLTFGASWCGWCGKMKAETFSDKAIEDLAGRFVWVEADLEAQQELAALFDVRGVPYTIVLDAQDRLLAAQAGFMPPDRFATFLEGALAKVGQAFQPDDESLEELLMRSLQPPDQSPTDEEGLAPSRTDVLMELVEQLAMPQRGGRKAVLSALEKRGAASWPALCELLADERLAVRAAAGHALAHVTRGGPRFGPFDPPALRDEQVAAWRKWIDSHSPVLSADPSIAPE